MVILKIFINNSTIYWYIYKIGKANILQMLIENGANINAKDVFDDTALHEAVGGGIFINNFNYSKNFKEKSKSWNFSFKVTKM